MTPSIGIAELLISLIAAICGLVIPIGIIYFLFVIYKKVSNIEEMLKKNEKE
jgi:hypothetical protein